VPPQLAHHFSLVETELLKFDLLGEYPSSFRSGGPRGDVLRLDLASVSVDQVSRLVMKTEKWQASKKSLIASSAHYHRDDRDKDPGDSRDSRNSQNRQTNTNTNTNTKATNKAKATGEKNEEIRMDADIHRYVPTYEYVNKRISKQLIQSKD